ncbi:MAG: hypothetical protein ACLQCU_12225 [Acidimicrobiales bacterium]
MSDLVRLRLRAGILSRPVQEPPSQKRTKPSRRAILIHVHADENERIVNAAAVETLDGVPVLIIVGVADGAAVANAEAWALTRGTQTANALAPIGVVGLDQLGRFVAKKCGTKRAALVAFDPPWTLGRLAAHVRKARSGGLSVGLVGCGWLNRQSGRWQDSDYYSRIGMISRGGEDAGAFCRWIPSRKRQKSDRGGSFVGLNVLGGALGYDAESPWSLATSAGVVWPERDSPLDQLVDEALALVACYRRLVADLAEAAPGLQPQACWSAGSFIVHGLKQAGVRQAVLTTATLSPEAIGASAASFHGGLPQARLVGVATQMALADLNWTYPTMLSLLGLTPHLSADHFEAVPVDVAEVEELFLSDGLRDRLDDRAFYHSIGSLFVLVEPHGEADLPCQREVDDGRYRFVVTRLDLSGGTLPIHACHLIGPGLAGQLSKIVSAFQVVPDGIAPGLETLRLPSGATADLTTGDYGHALIEERQKAEAIGDPLVRERRAALAKSLSVSGGWGVFARVDRQRPEPVESVRTSQDGKERRVRVYPKTETVLAYGLSGNELSIETERPDVPGPFTLWHIAAGIPAACTAEIAIARHDIEAAYGGTVAVVATDSIGVPVSQDGGLVPCPGGPHRLSDGREAIRAMTPDELRSVLARRDEVLHPNGGSAWKIECDSLDKATVGFVAGVNKLLLGREEGGRFHLVRSSDTGLGDHYLDPTGTRARLDDGRMAWPARLQEAFLADVCARGNEAPLRIPPNLTEWAELPALRAGRASTLDELRSLRRQLGDPTVQPFARYVIAPIKVEHPPVCLGTGRHPTTWKSWPWMQGGKTCRLGVRDGTGNLIRSEGKGTIFVVPSHREVFREWFSEHDLTVGGPKRGLRYVRPVRSHPALVDPIGRSGELAGERPEDDPIVFSAAVPVGLLTEASRLSGAEIARRSGLPSRTAQRLASGAVRPSPATVDIAVAAVVDREPARCAAGAECRHAEDSLGAVLDRRRRRWCGPACKKVAYRRARGIPARRRRPYVFGDRPASPPASNGSGIPVLRGLRASAFGGKPSCPACGSIFIGRVPETCPDCDTPLKKVATA